MDEAPTCGIGLAQHATIAQRELPMGVHDETAWSEAHLKAFEKFVKAQTQVLALLRVAAERDESMLASMTNRT